MHGETVKLQLLFQPLIKFIDFRLFWFVTLPYIKIK